MADKIYLNTASCGLLGGEAVLQDNLDFYHAMFTEASTASEIIRDQKMPQIRHSVAAFLGAKDHEIALVPNFSHALNELVQSLKGTEKVLLYKHDYPSLYEPFRINNFPISWIEAEADEFTISTDKLKEQLLRDQVEILAISHVQWLSGFRVELAELGTFCREHGILLIVDATQSLGAVSLKMDQLNIDVLIASNYKWMNAGFGTGIMYLSEHFQQRYQPVVGGHNSYATVNGEWKYVVSARSYEPGHLNLHGLLILDAAIRQKVKKGLANIETYNAGLTSLLLELLPEERIIGPKKMDHRSAIVFVKADPALQQHLADNQFVVTRREDRIRVSMHFYNTETEVRQFAACLNDFRER